MRTSNSSSHFAEERLFDQEEQDSRKPVLHPFEAHMMAAMGAGMINACLTNPLWVVKVRMQTQSSAETRAKYNSIPNTFRTIIHEEGYAGLFKGLPVSLVGTIHVVIQFPLYEYLKETQRAESMIFLQLYVLIVSLFRN
jgi:hypothetical protein